MTVKFGSALLIALFVNSAFAGDVKITSFIYTGARTRTAELCGKITSKIEVAPIVDITVDPDRNNPGSYTVIPAATGKFCTVVNTETGNADVSIRGSTESFRTSVK